MIGGFLQGGVFPQRSSPNWRPSSPIRCCRRFKNRVDYRRYNGAALLGLRGLVFKSHGSADEFAFEQALNRAYDAARNNLLDRVQARIAHARPLLAPAKPMRRRWTLSRPDR